MNHVTHSLSFADIKFYYIKKYIDVDCILTQFLIVLNFLEVFKDFLNKYGSNFDDVNKIGYSRPS